MSFNFLKYLRESRRFKLVKCSRSKFDESSLNLERLIGTPNPSRVLPFETLDLTLTIRNSHRGGHVCFFWRRVCFFTGTCMLSLHITGGCTGLDPMSIHD